ncbi:MAG: hypothetical protein RSD98_04905 [Niameybacter sp.]
MPWLYKLEKKFGKYAIPNLMMYILMGQALVFLITTLTGNVSIVTALMFDRGAILSGQIWRLISFIFIPNTFSPLMFLLMVFIYYSISQQLERYMGSFGFNVFYLSSIIASILVSFIFNGMPSIYYINLSLFIAFATLMPDATFYLYFIIPFKAKYLLVLYFILIGADILGGGLANFALIAASLLGYFIFFGLPALKHQKVRKSGYAGQKQFKAAKRELDVEKRAPIKVAFHKCHVCGKTELDDPDAEFRYCSSCNGNYEYCMNHLKNHEHVK